VLLVILRAPPTQLCHRPVHVDAMVAET